MDNCQRQLATMAEYRDTVNTKVFPDIVTDVQTIVDGSYRSYGLARLLIGGLVAPPPEKTNPIISRDDAGRITGRIGTSIAGARAVNLKSLIDRGERLAHLEEQRRNLLVKVEGLPPHPRGTPRNA